MAMAKSGERFIVGIIYLWIQMTLESVLISAPGSAARTQNAPCGIDALCSA